MPHFILLLSVLWRKTFHQKENYFTPLAFLRKETEMKPSWRKALLREEGEQKTILLYCLDQDISM